MNEPARTDDAGPYASGAAPAIGTGLAAVMVAATATPVRRGVDDPAVWAGAVFALLAIIFFLGSRYDRIDRQIAGPIAAASSFAVVVLSGYTLNQGTSVPATVPAAEWSISLQLLAFCTAAIATGIGVADYFRIGGYGLLYRAFYISVLSILAFATLFAAEFTTIVIAQPFVLTMDDLSVIQLVTLGQLGTAIGTAAVAVGYLLFRQYGLSYIDLRLPTRRDLAWMVGGIVALFGAVVGISALFEVTGVTIADHGTAQEAAENPELMLLLIPAAILIIGPFEELLYRNIIQKALYEQFSRYGAVVVASVIFAGAHVFAYATATAGAIIASLTVVFGLSIVLGVIYERTDNLVVPAIVHGVYDAILFANLYLTYAG